MHVEHRCVYDPGRKSNALLLYLHSAQVHAVPMVYSWASTSSQASTRRQNPYRWWSLCPNLLTVAATTTTTERRMGYRLPSVHALPLFQSPTMVKLTLWHPVMVLPTPWSRSSNNPSMADGTFLYRPKTLITAGLQSFLIRDLHPPAV